MPENVKTWREWIAQCLTETHLQPAEAPDQIDGPVSLLNGLIVMPIQFTPSPRALAHAAAVQSWVRALRAGENPPYPKY